MFRSFILLLCLSCSLAYAQGQTIKLKKGHVYLNGNAFLKYNKINGAEFSFYAPNGDELLFFQILNNCYGKGPDDDCMSLNFITAKIKFRVSDWSHVASLGIMNAMEKLIKWLVQEKVISENGELDLEKMDRFRDKYEDSRPLK